MTEETSGKTVSATNVLAFWTTGDGMLSNLIKPFSDPTHAGLIFNLDNGKSEYAESLFGEGFRAHKNTLNLIEWYYEHHQGQRLITLPLAITGNAAENVRQRAIALDGVAGYNTFQLFQLLAFKRWGIPVRPSPRRMICSEAQARLIYPWYDLRDATRPTFDSLTPQDTLERLRALIKSQPKGGPEESTSTSNATQTHAESMRTAPGFRPAGAVL